MTSAAVLIPIEFKDCLTDSPEFRKKLHGHEKELDRTSQAIKSLTKEIKNLVEAARSLSAAQRNLMVRLQSFAQDPNKGNLTEDEMVISQSFNAFAQIIKLVEDERQRILDCAEKQIIGPLEAFRKDAIGGAKERRKKFEKQTQKFYQSQERYLNLSTKKDGQVLQEADASLDMEQRHFVQASLEYVFLLHEVQERKKFEFVEIILSHTYSWLTFYHQGHDVYNDYKYYMTDLQERIQRTRENFNATRQEAFLLKNKMLEIQDPGSMDKLYTRQGYLFLMEKKAFGTTWTKYYCSYQKESREFVMTSYNQIQQKMEMHLKSCVRRASDTIDKRFCLDLTVQMHERDKDKFSSTQMITLQTLSEEDCKRWMDAMDGKEPVYLNPASGSVSPKEMTSLDENGLSFIVRAISVLENKGLEDQGLYRLVGVSSKVSKLLALGLDSAKNDKLNLEDPSEWEIKTITSAIKQYFRNLPEPLMTYKLHCDFILAAKQEKLNQRVNCTHYLVHKLPKINFKVLRILMQHLCNVARKANKNKMTVSNLGICFGPTLLRPEEESVAAIMNIKFCNIVVELLIDNFDKIFNTMPCASLELSMGESTLRQGAPISLSAPCTPKSSPTPTSNSSSSSSSSTMQAYASHSSSKINQPVLQTVVTSFTTSEPQTVHFGGSQSQLPHHHHHSHPAPASQHHLQHSYLTQGSSAASLARSEGTSNLKNQPGTHFGHLTLPPSYSSTCSAPPLPPTVSHLWSHGLPPPSNMNSAPLGSVHELYSNNFNNSIPRPAPFSGSHNGNIGGGVGGPPLSFINPLSESERNDCVESSSSSCDSLYSSSSRDVSHFAPASSSTVQSSSSPLSSARLGTAYPPTYRQHMETRSSLSGSQSISALPTLVSACVTSFPSSGFPSAQSSSNGLTTPCHRKRVRTLYACVGENESELSFEPNQILTNVRPSREPGWLEGTLNGKSGLVPENYVEFFDDNGSLPSLIPQRNTDV